MRHVPDGVLRRLDDEPLAVPDRVTEHLAGCGRCRSRRAEISQDAVHAARVLSGPRLVPDTDIAWAALRRELRAHPHAAPQRRLPVAGVARRGRLPRVSLRAGLVIGAVGAVIAGSAAAATLTTIFAPTHVAPVSVSRGELQAISTLAGLTDGRALGGFPSPNGSTATRFGTIRWSSPSPAPPASSLAQAEAQAGFPVSLPTHLPAGVGAVGQIAVQPQVSATMTFTSAAASLAGSSVTVHAGPAVLAQYSGAGQSEVPTLAVAAMRRPTASSTGASLSQIEAFVLAQPGIPPALAEEIRLLGDLRTVFPVPVPSGAAVRSVRVGGWPGVLLSDASNSAAGVIWEDGRGILHLVAGILDSQDVLNVARQIG